MISCEIAISTATFRPHTMNLDHSKKHLLRRACERVAYVMKGMLEDKGSTDTRLFGPPLIPDDLVAIGRSQDDACYREHVIPRLVICNHAEEMLKQGSSTIDLASFIADHLKIVHLTRSQSDLLNKKIHFNLRQRMPDGWNFGEDHFARLHEASIPYTQFGETQ